MNDGASDKVVEKSSKDCISERAPLVDMVNEEPDMRLEVYKWSRLRCSLSAPGAEYLKSRIGTASSVVYAWPIFMSESLAGKSRLSSHGFEFHVSVILLIPYSTS